MRPPYGDVERTAVMDELHRKKKAKGPFHPCNVSVSLAVSIQGCMVRTMSRFCTAHERPRELYFPGRYLATPTYLAHTRAVAKINQSASIDRTKDFPMGQEENDEQRERETKRKKKNGKKEGKRSKKGETPPACCARLGSTAARRHSMCRLGRSGQNPTQ